MTMAMKIAKAQQPPTEALLFNTKGEVVFGVPIRLRVANNLLSTTHREFFIMSEADRNIFKAICAPDQKSIRFYATEAPVARMDGSQGQDLYAFQRGGMFGQGA
jgi:hypothetical protein